MKPMWEPSDSKPAFAGTVHHPMLDGRCESCVNGTHKWGDQHWDEKAHGKLVWPSKTTGYIAVETDRGTDMYHMKGFTIVASDKDMSINVGLNVKRDQTLRELQTNLPWTIRYSRDYRANPQPHKDFAHALVHVSKALGKLFGLVDDMDHDREVADNPKLRAEYGKYVADLVVCALRAANTFPGGVLDLQSATEERIAVKNQTSLPSTPDWVKHTPKGVCQVSDVIQIHHSHKDRVQLDFSEEFYIVNRWDCEGRTVSYKTCCKVEPFARCQWRVNNGCLEFKPSDSFNGKYVLTDKMPRDMQTVWKYFTSQDKAAF